MGFGPECITFFNGFELKKLAKPLICSIIKVSKVPLKNMSPLNLRKPSMELVIVAGILIAAAASAALKRSSQLLQPVPVKRK